MQEIGFWKRSLNDNNDRRPHPQDFIDKTWKTIDPELYKKVIYYLQFDGFLESYEMGYSFCRFEDCFMHRNNNINIIKQMGCCTLTDGIFCWPEGYIHYIIYHSVKPPLFFLKYIENKYNTEPFEYINVKKKQLYMYDPLQNKNSTLSLEMRKIISQFTTLKNYYII